MPYLFSFIFAFLVTGCALHIETDYDPDVLLEKPQRFSVIHKTYEGEDTLTVERITKAIETELQAKGFIKGPKDEADFYVLFHIGITTKKHIDTSYRYNNVHPYIYGSGYGYGYGYFYTATVVPTEGYTYDEEKLLIDVVLPEHNSIVWRGTVTDDLDSLPKPKDKIRYIDKIVHKLFEHFPR